ncbi:MAG: hypothetical protein HW418_3240 [Anaerolineales bacterium]|nr:hypothetical protein [Anaerolineales bacterium]
MAERQFVKTTLEDRVAILTIDHPPVNALSAATMAELSDAVDEMIANPEVKAVVITGQRVHAGAERANGGWRLPARAGRLQQD